MSSSYRLEAPRPRHPQNRPHPITILNTSNSYNSNSVTSPSISSFNRDRDNDKDRPSETLLYDLPSISPPTSPTSPRRGRNIVSPTSPTSRSQSMAPSQRRTPPLPGSAGHSKRNRSVTPLGVSQSELEAFAEYCRAWYYDQNPQAGHFMQKTLSSIPPSQRTSFSRLQASIRAAYHRSVNARRTAEFRAHLSATGVGGSLMPVGRADPWGSVARRERHERFTRFVSTWANLGMPGTIPFFEALYAVLRLQSIPQSLGGAGGKRIQWEFDDAVFMEAAGKDFMLEAIDVLKGVLGFEDFAVQLSAPTSPTTSSPPLPNSRRLSNAHTNPNYYPIHTHLATIQSRSSQPSPPPPPPSSSPPPPSSSPQTPPLPTPNRARAPSDPFLDVRPSTPGLSHSVGSSMGMTVGMASSYSSGVDAAGDGDGGALLDGSRDRDLDGDGDGEGLMSPVSPEERDRDRDGFGFGFGRRKGGRGSGGGAERMVILDKNNTNKKQTTVTKQDVPQQPKSPPPIDDGGGGFEREEEEYPDLEDIPHLRIWTAPDLTNAEYVALAGEFPGFISRRAMPRFGGDKQSGGASGTSGSSRSRGRKRGRGRDAEEGLTTEPEVGKEGDDGRTSIRFGTGRMWVGEKMRKNGWKGGFWVRFMLWWRKIFC